MITALIVKFWRWWKTLSDSEQMILGLAGFLLAGILYLLAFEYPVGKWLAIFALYMSVDYFYYFQQHRYFLRRHKQGFQLIKK